MASSSMIEPSEAPSGNGVGTSRPLDWLRGYDARALRGDLIAGATLAAYILPVALAYSSLAGLPPEAGLYSCILAGLAFAPFCSSRRTAVATTSAVSLLLGTTLGSLSSGDAARHTSLAAETALYVGLICVAARLLRAGRVVDFMSDVVLTVSRPSPLSPPALAGFRASRSRSSSWQRPSGVCRSSIRRRSACA
jgi:hypothetical protein